MNAAPSLFCFLLQAFSSKTKHLSLSTSELACEQLTTTIKSIVHGSYLSLLNYTIELGKKERKNLDKRNRDGMTGEL